MILCPFYIFSIFASHIRDLHKLAATRNNGLIVVTICDNNYDTRSLCCLTALYVLGMNLKRKCTQCLHK